MIPGVYFDEVYVVSESRMVVEKGLWKYSLLIETELPFYEVRRVRVTDGKWYIRDGFNKYHQSTPENCYDGNFYVMYILPQLKK